VAVISMSKNHRSEKPNYSTPSYPGYSPGPSVADREFDRARRAGFIQDILAPVRNQPADLLPFEEVRSRLHLSSQTYKGLQEVSLDQIVGSVARYHDFSRAFRPRRESLRRRWQRARKLHGRLPPIDLYQVGDAYFVVDGNHRVSVARQAGAERIQAHVCQYETRVPVESNDNLDDIFIRQEYLEFLEQSRLDVTRPEQRIVFTVPGRYRQLGEAMARHREWLDRQHIYTVSFEEAAADWFDTVYTPMVNVIREKNILAEFPGRTEADLVAYILRYRGELRRQWIETSLTPAPSLVDAQPFEDRSATPERQQGATQVAHEFVAKVRHDWWGRLVAWIKRRILRWEILDGSSREETE
jgi:uncharacterized ParB-like nuclease family protein